MKKLFTLVAVAALAVACCNNQPAAVTVEKFFENPKAFVAQDTTLTGTIQSGCITGQFTLAAATNSEKMQLLIIPAAEGIKLCPGCAGKTANVKGMITEVIVDAEFITNLENEANAEENVEIKEGKLKKVAEFRETLSTGGVFSLYAIAATAVTSTDCQKDGQASCCKEGGAQAEAACCKSDSTQCAKSCEKKS